jgi:NH3-dependent NAD+ synthetase
LVRELTNYHRNGGLFMSEQEIRDLFKDEAYVSSLLALDTAEEVQASLAEKGVDISTTEITKILDSIRNYSESDEELSEADLENVTGGLVGVALLFFAGLMGIIGLGTTAGMLSMEDSSGRRRRW